MKLGKALSLSFSLVAFAAGAATVSVDAVKLAAGSWALSNASLGVPHGRAVDAAAPYDVDGVAGFYAVSLAGGGTVFIAADDEMSPVIGFTVSSSPDLSVRSPLRAILESDVRVRRRAAGRASALGAQASASAPGASDARRLWSALTRSGAAPSDPALLAASESPREVDAISDLRVDQLVQSKWSQTEDKLGRPCYNYYTPNNYPSGCTATAAGQIMRYFGYPTQELPALTRTCTVDGEERELSTFGESRVYDWANLKLDPNASSTEDERRAIGRFLSDAGIALRSEYTSGFTGVSPSELSHFYQDDYAYASGIMYMNESGWNTGKGGLYTREIRNKVIYASLDAKRPLQFGIYGYDRYGQWVGHSVVCDGYGFVTIGGVETEFAHINMGWAGTDDMWYNIPEINAANSGAYVGQSGMDFLYLACAVYNIHPTETGDLLTGRVVEDDEPVAGATVVLCEAGSAIPVAYATSDGRGIYSFSIPGGKSYDVHAFSSDGQRSGTADDVYLPTTVEDPGEYPHYVATDSDVGNSWGNDVDISVPYVRVRTSEGSALFNNLNTALAAAAKLDDPVVELFGPTRLKKPVTIVTNMTICVAADPSSEFPAIDDCGITVLDGAVTAGGWAVQVADGVRVALSNVVFEAESGSLPCIDVLASGSVSVAGRVCVGTVRPADVGGFVLAGAIEPVRAGVSVEYAAAAARYSRFGAYECSAGDAESCAKLIVNALDPTLMGSVGEEEGSLVWDRVSVSPDVAAAYATNEAMGTTYYRSLDLLFQDYAGGAEVVLLRDCTPEMLTNVVEVSNSTTIASKEGSSFTVTASERAGFTVTGGAELVLANAVFTRSGSGTQHFFTVDGGSLVLDDGAAIGGLSLSGSRPGACAVYVAGGTVALRDGSAITNCVATSGHQGRASAVYLAGADCAMDFRGGTIAGCVSGHGSGAAVYAGAGARIDVSGSASADGNLPGDVYFYQASMLTLAGPLTGSVGVNCATGYKAGKPFATVGDGVSQEAAKMACGHFSNNRNAGLSAAVSEDGGTLVWAEEATGPQPVPEADAVARLVVDDASDTYASLDDALEMAGGADARIELLRDTSLVRSLSVEGTLVLDGMGNALHRDGDFCLAVTNSSLTLTNIFMSGAMGEGRLIDVRGGSLALQDGAVVSFVYGFDSSMVAPIVVWDGTFVMESGAEISDCWNFYEAGASDSLTAGAVLVNGQNAAAEFRGGTVAYCMAARAGGVYVGNKAKVSVRGDTTIKGNELLSGGECNLVVQDKSELALSGILTGRIGYTEGVFGDTNVFGVVDAAFAESTTASNLVVSARRFRNDRTESKGMVATNATEAILVWSSAVGDSTEFTNVVDGVETVYDVVLVEVDDDDPEIVECEPFACVALEEVSEGTWKLTLKPGTKHCVYTLRASDDLSKDAEDWDTVDQKTLTDADIGEDLEFVFEAPASGARRFWKVEGADGIR